MQEQELTEALHQLILEGAPERRDEPENLWDSEHVRHHAAQLNVLLRQATDSAPHWVLKGGQNIKS